MTGLSTVALGIASTRWACRTVCHEWTSVFGPEYAVMGDAYAAYELSSHSEVSCYSCHGIVNATPFEFLEDKAEFVWDGSYKLITRSWEAPLNPDSELALHPIKMPEDRCTQCHSDKWDSATFSEGILIDHAAHRKKGVRCTFCHNRVAHREDLFETRREAVSTVGYHGDAVRTATRCIRCHRLDRAPAVPGGCAECHVNAVTARVRSPNGVVAGRHEDFMEMAACFRCHSGDQESGASGKCGTCHPTGFDLKPHSHDNGRFVTDLRARAAHSSMAAYMRVTVSEGLICVDGEPSSETTAEPPWDDLPTMAQEPYCSMCHESAFCTGCHGLRDMPHSRYFRSCELIGREGAEAEEFLGGHAEAARAKPRTCEKCHISDMTHFCDECHHGSEIDWAFDSQRDWVSQHFGVVAQRAEPLCLDRCHERPFCVSCHAGGKLNGDRVRGRV